MTSTRIATAAMDQFLTQMPPLSLAELNEGASLLTRTDRKYVIAATDVAQVLAAVSGAHTRVLEIDGRREFGYESTYFDTPELANYTAAAYGRRRRFKLRTRVYADSGECYFEVKTKGARGNNVKQRIAHGLAERSSLTGDARDFADSCVADAGVGLGLSPVLSRDWSPVVDTRYFRSTLVIGQTPLNGDASGDSENDSSTNSSGDALTRMTIDRGLTWHSPTGRQISAGHVVVVETKSASLTPSAVDYQLWRLGHRPARISKYCTGLALLDPQLPANRWHRVTTRQLQLVLFDEFDEFVQLKGGDR